MTRIVIHAGFHKTGTTSVQTMAAQNAERLAPHSRVCLRDDFRGLTDAARTYSAARRAADLERVFAAAEHFFGTLDKADPRPVALLSEDLSGHLPGRHDIADYSAAPALMAQIAAAAVTVLGDAADLRFHFSTRAAEPWFRSAYWQILRSARRTEGPADFAKLFAGAVDFDTVVTGVAEAVAPFPVQALALEQMSGLAQGPMTPVLDLLEVPEAARTGLQAETMANARPKGLDDVFLALNRCALPDGKVVSLKKTMLRMARRIEARRER